MVKKVTVKEALKLKNTLLIDTRSPKEYHNDHIEGAINLPLLNDQERHEVGIIYKQISREDAIEKGRHAHHYLQYSLFIFMMVLIVFFVRSPTLTGMAVYEE